MSKRVFTFAYSDDYHPPMPVIEVGLNVPGRDQAATQFVAMIDSGSDGTLVPIDVLEAVNARYVGDARMRGLLGDSQSVDIYLASLYIGSQIVHAVRVIAAPPDEEAILGRNVLNNLVITLNGPASTTELLG